MSQGVVLDLLKERGKATTKELKQLAKDRYPGLSLYTYVGLRLNQLQKWGMVLKDKQGFWHVVEEAA